MPVLGPWLTKSAVNAFYYNTVAGEIAFGTEAQGRVHARAVAKLIAGHAESLGKRRIRILEIAANNCAFARSLLEELVNLVDDGAAALDRIDYVAVEYARGSLEAAAAWEQEYGVHDRVLRPPDWRETIDVAGPQRPTLVALFVDDGPPVVNLGLVHAEATQFVHATEEQFDFAILNELLDDLPYRVYYSDAAGHRHEAVARARVEEQGWTVRIEAEEAEDDPACGDLPPAALTARSPEAVDLVGGISSLLGDGGMLLLHDYGFAGTYTTLAEYEGEPPSLPTFVTMELPDGSDGGFPHSFYRVFGNEQLRVLQVTNDVNFGELVAALEAAGTVTVMAHGNAIANRPDRTLTKGDGVFLSEFGLLESGDDLPSLLADLNARQNDLREAYAREYVSGHGSVFLDLIFVKSRSRPTGT
jgi:hypothetical protein